MASKVLARGCVGLVVVLSRVGAQTQRIEALALEEVGRSRDALRAMGAVGLHVGCGLQLATGVLNTDIQGIAGFGGRSSKEAPLVVVTTEGERRYFLEHDATLEFPLADGSFDWVFAEHFIEHVSRPDATAFLREARRLVARGGVIRISTPDLAKYCRGYLDPNRDFLTAHHAAMTTGPMEGFNGHLRPTGAALFNDLFRSYGHMHIYDFDEVLAVADDAGILVPLGDCVAEQSIFNHSSHILHVAHRLDDPVKAHESLYVDFVCGATRTPR